MIQVHSKTILSMEFKSIIKAMIQTHNDSFIQSPILIDNIKTQFLLAISKFNSYWQHQNSILIGNIKTQFSLAISKFNSYWQHESPILIGNIKAQFSLAISKSNSYWQHQNSILISTTLSKRKELKIINAWQRKNIMLKCYCGKKGSWQSSYEETH